MWCDMRKIFFCISAFVCLLLAAGCSKGKEETPTAAPRAADNRSVADDSRAANQYTLTYTAGDHGTIDGASTQTVNQGGAGSAVTAVPAAGYHFVSWSDGLTSAGRTDTDVTSDLAVTASFAIDRHTLTYTAGDHGTIDGARAQTVKHGGSGSAVTAVPAAGYHFVSWSDGAATARRNDAGVTSDLTVTATFALNQYTLVYTAGDHGTIDGASPQTVNHGEAGSSVAAVADKGYHFVSWSDGVDTAIRTDKNVTGDISVSASFEVNTYTVGGTVAGLAEGTKVVLQNNGGDNLTVNGNGSFTFATALPDGRPYAATVLTQPTSPNQTCTVTKGAGKIAGANIAEVSVNCIFNTYAIGGKVVGLPGGNQLVLQNNKGDDLVVSANGEFTFAKALNDGSAYEVTIQNQQLKPKWFCGVENGKGKLVGRDVNNVDIACFPEAELQAMAGLGKIDLKWNSHDFKGAVFTLCRAQEEILAGDFSRCTNLKGGGLETKVRSPHTLSRLAYDVPYWVQLEVKHPGGRRTYSAVVTATPFSGLNDTGIDWCADNETNRSIEGPRESNAAGCKAVAGSHPGQDAQQGRDMAARNRKLDKLGSGVAGFDFTKVCMNGEVAGEGKCPPNPTPGNGNDNWACTIDNVTGLTWEVKTSDGLRSQSNTYTWFNPDGAVNGGVPGVQNGGRCTGSGCDTHAYVQAVNTKGLCGGRDWRLPTRKELLSIVNNGRFSPAIDSRNFPNTQTSSYWSASTYADQAKAAWQVNFKYGEVAPGDKDQGANVRLVRRAR